LHPLDIAILQSAISNWTACPLDIAPKVWQRRAARCNTPAKNNFFAMIARFARKFGNLRFAPELKETNQMAVMIPNQKKNTPKDCFFLYVIS
jgi:hypothetical protein